MPHDTTHPKKISPRQLKPPGFRTSQDPSKISTVTREKSSTAGAEPMGVVRKNGSEAGGSSPLQSTSSNDTETAPPTIRIWTDGACIGNPGPGGWAFVMILDGETQVGAGGVSARTTNIEMELVAVIQALRAVKHFDLPVIVYSDLEMIPRGMNQWLPGWVRNGWRTSKGKPVAHRQLWEELLALRDARAPGAKITFRWVKGHTGHEENEEANRWAQDAAAMASRSALSCRTRYDAVAGLMVPE